MKTPHDYQQLIITHVQGRRPQVLALMQRLDKSGFFKAPASSSPSKHLACEGGLAQHTWHVIHAMMRLVDVLFTTAEFDYTCPPASSASNKVDLYESCVIIGLCHDLNKGNMFGSDFYLPNILKGGKQSESKPYERSTERAALGGQLETLLLASRYVDLKQDEIQAIAWCEGLYNRQYMVDVAGKEFFLTHIAHMADMMSAHIVENHEPLSRPRQNLGDHEAAFGVSSIVPRANGVQVEA